MEGFAAAREGAAARGGGAARDGAATRRVGAADREGGRSGAAASGKIGLVYVSLGMGTGTTALDGARAALGTWGSSALGMTRGGARGFGAGTEVFEISSLGLTSSLGLGSSSFFGSGATGLGGGYAN